LIELRNTFPVIAIDHEHDMSPIGGCLATTGMGIHINAKAGIEPCGILHYYDTFIRDGESIEDSVKKSVLLKEIRSLYTSSSSCPLIDRLHDLSDLIKRVFPETYTDFTDFKFLEEYKKTFRCQDVFPPMSLVFLPSVCPSPIHLPASLRSASITMLPRYYEGSVLCTVTPLCRHP
jgi:hypothetical protein